MSPSRRCRPSPRCRESRALCSRRSGRADAWCRARWGSRTTKPVPPTSRCRSTRACARSRWRTASTPTIRPRRRFAPAWSSRCGSPAPASERSARSAARASGRFDTSTVDEIEQLAGRATPALWNARRFTEAHALADLDPLTRLHNRRYFHELLEREVARAHRYRRRVSLLVLDVDDFSGLNARIGRHGADAVLVELARQLRLAVRTADIPCRIGEDEFAVILPESEAGGAELLAQRVAARRRRAAGRRRLRRPRVGRRLRPAAGRPRGRPGPPRRGRSGQGEGRRAAAGLPRPAEARTRTRFGRAEGRTAGARHRGRWRCAERLVPGTEG